MNTLKTNKDEILFPMIVQIFCAKQMKQWSEHFQHYVTLSLFNQYFFNDVFNYCLCICELTL